VTLSESPEWFEVRDGETRWRIDAAFLRSNWTCIWGRGCQGILDEPAADLNQGCCSVGAELADQEEAMRLSAYAAMLEPSGFQYYETARGHGSREDARGHGSREDAREHGSREDAREHGSREDAREHGSREDAREHGIFSDESRSNTALIDDACIFLNRPGFPGGPGCALHLAALEAGELPTEWKPSVCWQLPVRVDWTGVDGGERATLRRWSRADWGVEGETMAWVCTEEADAYVGESRVIDSLSEELEAIVGTAVYVKLRSHLGEQA